MRSRESQIGCWVIVAGLASGCSFDSGGVAWDAGAGDSDAPPLADGALVDGPLPDGSTPVVDAAPDWDACPGGSIGIDISNLDPCVIPAPGAAIAPDPGDWFLHTDDGTMYADITGEVVPLVSAVVAQQTSGPNVRVVSTTELTISAGTRLYVSGSLPLVIVSFGDATIDDLFFVGADNARPGAGGDLPGACNTSAGDDGILQDGKGSGGGGGAYGGSGGDGAKVSGAGGSPLPVAGGSPTGNAEITPLRGGCKGGDGANNPSLGGLGGGGGGALQLVADGALSIGSGGAITARGGGATGTEEQSPNADPAAGGGGGGSGGAILLEAESMTIDGYVAANGGGGSEGTYGGGSAPGQAGEDGYSFSDTAAGGGGDWCYGGNGGNGGSGAAVAGDGSQGEVDAAGGGGGGGGVGRIHFNSVGTPIISPFAIISPAEE